MRHSKAIGLLLLLLLVSLVGTPTWLTYHQERQDVLDHALIAAIKRDDTPAALSLLGQGADANARDELNQKPTSLWQLLLDTVRGKHVSPATGPTALLVLLESEREWEDIAPSEHAPLVKALLEHGAEVNVQDSQGMTSLLLAAYWGQADTLKLLLAHSADVNKPNTRGITPLMDALDYPNLLSILLTHRADVNARDKDGFTALMYASRDGRMKAVHILLHHHANVNIQNKYGGTALSLAEEGPHAAIVHLLKQAGAKE